VASTSEVDTSAGSGSGSKEMRLDVQGLRALAVALVIAFHAGLPVPGGFIGVDVFFVISGFVIALTLQREWRATHGIALRRFYVRRVKRLMPALGLLVLVVCIGAAFLQSPLGPQQVTGLTGAAAMLSVANWAIAATSGNYFDDAATYNPLLHTWSLSVEEQFYLVFPAVLLGMLILGLRRKRGMTPVIAAMAVVATTSFMLAVLGSLGYGYVLGNWSWLTGFYSPFTRAWEFALGALLALASMKRPSARVGALSAAAGLGFIGIGAFIINSTTPFPGLMTLFPVVGALAFIYGNSSDSQRISQLFSTRTFVKAGDWSYSLYLWHWPFIVFAIALFPTLGMAPLLGAALSLPVAVVAFKLVEDPVRRWRLPLGRTRITALWLLWVIPLAAAGLLRISADAGWALTGAQQEVQIGSANDLTEASINEPLFARFAYPCPQLPVRTVENPEGTASCVMSRAGEPIDLAIVGDSHAWQIYPAMAAALERGNVALVDVQGLPYLSDPVAAPGVQFLIDNPPPAVLIADWWHYRGVSDELRDSVRKMTEAGSDVFVLDAFPFFPFSPEACYAPAAATASQCAIPREQANDVLSRYADKLAQLVAEGGGQVLHTYDYFCSDRECSMVKDGNLIYFNDSHLNWTGTEYAVARLLAEHPQLARGMAGL
jgi:peptidoglycan/LPS O-acetylase OafA/YrhL